MTTSAWVASTGVEETQSGEQFVGLRPVSDSVDATTTPGAAERVHAGVDSDVDGGDSARSPIGDVRRQACVVWQESVAAGMPLTGRELGVRFGRSERWGRDRIAEARPAGSGSDGTTARRRRPGGKGAAPDAQGRHDTRRADDRGGSAGVDGAQGASAVPDAPLVAVVPPEVPVGVPGGARLVAWAGFLFGTVISVAANVLYVWLPAMRGEAGPPGVAPQVGAAVWPIALVLSVEVLSRVPWRPGWAWWLARYGGAGVVAAGAAVISYGHLSGVLAAWGYGTAGTAVGPLVVDGLMTISGFALLAMGANGARGTAGVGR